MLAHARDAVIVGAVIACVCFIAGIIHLIASTGRLR